MIVTKEDAREAMVCLFGDTNPRQADLSDQELEFYEGFIKPILDDISEVKILGFVEPVEIDEDDDIATLISIVGSDNLPLYIFPGGYPIAYENLDCKTMCDTCAQEARESSDPRARTLFWKVVWDCETEKADCDECGDVFLLLEDYDGK